LKLKPKKYLQSVISKKEAQRTKRSISPDQVSITNRCRCNQFGASMNFHEYQSKELFAKFGLPVPLGHVAFMLAVAAKQAVSSFARRLHKYAMLQQRCSAPKW
jgi:hypothetical protein